MASNPVVYDKAKYHFESVAKDGINEVQAYVHTAFYLRWILENKLYSEEFYEDTKEFLEQFQKGAVTALEIYRHWDGCLVDNMLNDEGNAFSQIYFVFDRGQYLKDYEILEKEFPSVFHVPFNDENYFRIKPRIDKAYQSWKTPKPWWKF